MKIPRQEFLLLIYKKYPESICDSCARKLPPGEFVTDDEALGALQAAHIEQQEPQPSLGNIRFTSRGNPDDFNETLFKELSSQSGQEVYPPGKIHASYDPERRQF